ncbi:dynein axonemal intermediate chain 4 [Clupea harengus]|uniref:Dynein axonemal intermediate chain 4 n=1 Tax=Clupea harengus TaxID=7950 RepID=A0A8M1KTB3_CLUHA|nr:dynein axonemal intermediate chain 4 [Clupea harengus]
MVARTVQTALMCICVFLPVKGFISEMSNNTIKMKKSTLKVTPSSRAVNTSTSGLLRVNLSTTRSVTASVSRKSLSLAGDSKVLDKSSLQTPKHTVQVFDENGKDVTPQPLFHPDPGGLQPKQSKIFTGHDNSGATVSDLYSTAFQTTNASFAGPFTRSVFGSSTVSRSSQSTMNSMTDEIEDPSSKRDVSISLSDVHVRREEVKEQIREDMLDEVVDQYLTESDTIWLLDMPAVSVSVDSEEAEAVRQRNMTYTELCKNREGNDKYMERSMQTFNGAPKNKEVQCENIAMSDAATMATTWDLYDSYCSPSAEGQGAAAADGERRACSDVMSCHRLGSIAPDMSMSVVSSASIGDANTLNCIQHTSHITRKVYKCEEWYSVSASGSSSRIQVQAYVVQLEEEPDPELILQSDEFKMDLVVMERVVLENIYQPELAAYRHLAVLQDPDRELKAEAASITAKEGGSSPTPTMERLWSFGCVLTTGRNVSCMAWNKKNPDLLAVGYGQFDYKDQKSGLVCCWSLKNPTWPERIFHSDSGVTALDFSANNASQLAVGMHDGSLATYNVQNTEDSPVVDSSDCVHKHTSAVWQVKWVNQEKGLMGEDKGESLITVSADGRIIKWFLRKGMDCIDLMKLKRTRNDKPGKQAREKERKTEALISRQAPGMCFDFHPQDSNIYLVGTEEGHVHKCSCSYNEQFLETYHGHRGPIYKIEWSPFCTGAFLSCSSDWTVQLWQQDCCTPVLGFTSTQRAVHDIKWSAMWPTVFGAVNEGRVEIWDLAVSILDPTIVSPAKPGVKLTTLLFAMETECILVGDSDGQVSVYHLRNMPGDTVKVGI